MRWVNSPPLSRSLDAAQRRGNVSFFLLLFIGLTIPTMFMMINVWRVAEGKVQQQNFSDAAAHAAACMLTSETNSAPRYSPLLFGDAGDIRSHLMNVCIPEAHNYAAKNFVDGKELKLDTTPSATDAKFKDVKFGIFNFDDANPAFQAIDPINAPAEVVRMINAVRVEAFRTVARSNSIRLAGPAWTGKTNAQIVTQATVALDRRVIGFQIQKNMAETPAPLGYQKIPMAPILLLNDGGPISWKTMVEAPADPSQPKLAYGTMTVNIPTATFPPGPLLNSQLLDIGVADVSEMAAQLREGITATQVKALSKGLLLDKTSYTVPVPTFSPVPAGDPTPGSDFDILYQTFLTLKANNTERAWPLCDLLPLSGADATVSGFVAARIINVQILQHGGSSPTSYIQLTLQPTLLETPTAFTDYSNRFLKTASPPSPYAGYARIVNRYLGRVRFVD